MTKEKNENKTHQKSDRKCQITQVLETFDYKPS